jgi:hypothetical protein
MKSKQVGYVLIALIAIGVAGLVLRIVSASSNDLVLTGLLPVTPDVIDAVAIKSPEGEVRLDRVGNEFPFSWRIGLDQAFQPKVDQFWAAVADIDGAQLVARNPANHERMGVLEGQGTRVSLLLGGFEQESFIVGTWSRDVRLCYVRRVGSDEVYGIPCASPLVFDPNPDGWRNPVVVSIPDTDVESITFTYPNEEFVLRREDRQWVVDSLAGQGQLADVFAVNSILGSIQGLLATGFAREDETANLDFSGPDAISVQIATTEQSNFPTTRVRLLRRDDVSYYARTPVQSTVFIIDSSVANGLLLQSTDLIVP